MFGVKKALGSVHGDQGDEYHCGSFLAARSLSNRVKFLMFANRDAFVAIESYRTYILDQRASR